MYYKRLIEVPGRAAKIKCDGKLPACTACDKSGVRTACLLTLQSDTRETLIDYHALLVLDFARHRLTYL